MKEELDLNKGSHFRFWDSLSEDKKAENIKKIQSKIGVHSEIGKLRKVFLHSPGQEVESMTPKSASELLYNDIIYYKNIVAGHAQLKSVLSLVSEVLEVSTCLEEILDLQQARNELLDQILYYQGCPDLKFELSEMPSDELARTLITGVSLKRNSLESWLSSKTFSLVPLPNMYFMRDTSMVVGTRVISSRMASTVRFTESLIMRAIYEYHPDLTGHGLLLDACYKNNDPKFTIEGGDIIVVNEDLLLVGISERTTTKAVDALVDSILSARSQEGKTEPFNILCVILPQERSTIHLDMIFTVANKEQAVVYSPYVLGRERARVVRIRVKSDGDKKFKDVEDLILGLRSVGVRMDPIPCGGDNPLHQQREQWNSGANLFSFAPGKVISYMHEHTLLACESAGFKIVSAKDAIKHPALLSSESPLVVTVEGSELSRGGGGPRCMTCPVLRDPV
ncbi:arginine deiminase [Fluviispira vulneris]|uniref:arginine deiminase n=1 Tax=Fluviispira vulneris TaxID=2763012 RepID=UPI001644F92A|nr:arginine deiminase family protein [Fluviispira vulneris]